jgi:hypothetical protein
MHIMCWLVWHGLSVELACAIPDTTTYNSKRLVAMELGAVALQTLALEKKGAVQQHRHHKIPGFVGNVT